MLRAGLHLDTRVQFLSEDFHSKTGKVAKSARAGRPRTRFSASVLRPNSQCLECPADPCRPPGRKGGLHLGLWRLDVSKGAATGVTWRMRSAVRSSDPPLDVQLLLLEARLPRYRVRVGRMPGCATDPGALSCAGHRRRNAPCSHAFLWRWRRVGNGPAMRGRRPMGTRIPGHDSGNSAPKRSCPRKPQGHRNHIGPRPDAGPQPLSPSGVLTQPGVRLPRSRRSAAGGRGRRSRRTRPAGAAPRRARPDPGRTGQR